MKHTFKTLFLLIQAALVGCTPILKNYSPNGSKDKLAIVYTPKDNGVKFECLDSHSGICYFTVKNSGCNLTKFYLIYREESCYDSLTSFNLVVGESKVLPEPPIKYEVCISEISNPQFPACSINMKNSSYQEENKFGKVTMVYPNYSK
jgi:hypothetical protein